MIISIFTLQCLILLGIIILLLRRRVIVHPNNEWSTLSENLTREYWNSLVDVEHELFRESLFQLSEKQADDPMVLAKAFQDTADEYYRRAHEMASLNSYGVDPRLHNYAIISSSWISRQAANYQEWSEAIKHDLSDSQEAWLSSAPEARAWRSHQSISSRGLSSDTPGFRKRSGIDPEGIAEPCICCCDPFGIRLFCFASLSGGVAALNPRLRSSDAFGIASKMSKLQIWLKSRRMFP